MNLEAFLSEVREAVAANDRAAFTEEARLLVAWNDFEAEVAGSSAAA